MPLKVEKKDGTQEDFDRNKVASGIVKSGAASDVAENVASQVESWAGGAAVAGVIRAADIRAKVLELLRAANPEIATSFEMYQKPVV
ncbi:MAG: ATP cone domain-containing protein [bacterium]|nr:ATP cone domain-containing protein [bacterium]